MLDVYRCSHSPVHGAPTHRYMVHVSEHPHCKDGGLKYSHLPKAEMGFVSWLSQVLSSE